MLPIVGASRRDQLDASLAAPAMQLTDAELSRLTEVSEPPRGYPWDFGAAGGRPARELRSP